MFCSTNPINDADDVIAMFLRPLDCRIPKYSFPRNLMESIFGSVAFDKTIFHVSLFPVAAIAVVSTLFFLMLLSLLLKLVTPLDECVCMCDCRGERCIMIIIISMEIFPRYSAMRFENAWLFVNALEMCILPPNDK